MPQIKPFNWRRHARDVLQFQKEIYENNFPGFVATEEFLRGYGQQIRQYMTSHTDGLFVLEEDGRTCGFLWLSLISTMVDPCIGYIKNIYVAPELRGRGCGKMLLTFAEAWCSRRGVARIALDASCCNETAVKLYEKTGYRTVRVRMEKAIEPSAEAQEEGTFLAELNKYLGTPLGGEPH